ncbi:hypothetical protein ACE14D_18825 [Streptomyces sp. Act-28]
MTEGSPRPSSGLLRRVLKVDAATSSGPGLVLVISVLLGLGSTGSPAGYIAAGVLFTSWVCVGIIGKRHESAKGRRGSSAEDG